MEHGPVYAAYGAAGATALAVFVALPRQGRPPRRGLLLICLGVALGSLVMLLAELVGAAANRFYFCALAVLAVGGAIRVVTHPRPVYSALFFVLVVVSTAGLVVLSGAEFLGAALVIVYAGAILVTYVFVIMLAQQAPLAPGESNPRAAACDIDSREPSAAVLAGFVLTGTIAGALVGDSAAPFEATRAAAGGNTQAIGRLLLTDFAVSVELAGVLLMVAMIGAIAVARRRLRHAPAEEPTRGEIGKRVKPF